MKNINNNKAISRLVNFRIQDDLFSDMELIREKLGINWSFAIRDFINDKVSELKPTAQSKIKR